MDEKELTQLDYEAADRLIDHLCVRDEDRDESREWFAQVHAEFGPWRFECLYGRRQPEDPIEEMIILAHLGKISENEMNEKLREYNEQPVDQRLIDRTYDHLDVIISQYSRGLESAATTLSSECSETKRWKLEAKATESFLLAKRWILIDVNQVVKLTELVADARLELALGNAMLGEYSGTTALDMTFQILDRAVKSWNAHLDLAKKSRCRNTYAYSLTAAELLFDSNAGPNLPQPHSVSTLLKQERTAATKVLLNRKTNVGSGHRFTINDAQIEILQANLNVVKSTDAEKTASNPLLVVANWADIGVGIDEKRQFWVVSPVPNKGEPVVMSKAIQIDLRGERWAPLLESFAESTTGNSVPIDQLAPRLGILPPAPSTSTDPRARRGAVESANTIDMNIKGSASRTALISVLKELSRTFRRYIVGPKGKGKACFGLEGDQVRCRFVVRYLLRNESGSFSFGEAGHDFGG